MSSLQDRGDAFAGLTSECYLCMVGNIVCVDEVLKLAGVVPY